jgi:hypothetical protein
VSANVLIPVFVWFMLLIKRERCLAMMACNDERDGDQLLLAYSQQMMIELMMIQNNDFLIQWRRFICTTSGNVSVWTSMFNTYLEKDVFAKAKLYIVTNTDYSCCNHFLFDKFDVNETLAVFYIPYTCNSIQISLYFDWCHIRPKLHIITRSFQSILISFVSNFGDRLRTLINIVLSSEMAHQHLVCVYTSQINTIFGIFSSSEIWCHP